MARKTEQVFQAHVGVVERLTLRVSETLRV
jgi:hypothetical protein